ncbi:polypeptide N-acetylgalactosaminyltransferase [Caerostris darwini]|uniref:Polypeptide N-acetylgalactosaminyltransferase n=1 Tax=Caerostris darwini TaxID=1538125 RepID=A0AAV4VBI2_9ARAC|nr:polypeptide N-acetylgalactosaminyltransferase [Caerostris darwini]
MLYFQRRKSLIVKLVLIVPITWIIVTTLLSLTEKLNIEKDEDGIEVPNLSNLVNEPPIVTMSGDKYEGRKPRQSMEEPPKVSIMPPIKIETKPNEDYPVQAHDIHLDDRPDLAVLLPPREPEGPGEGGKPVQLVNLTEAQQQLVKEGWERNAFNQYISDIISLHRHLPDVRPRGHAIG